MAVVVKVIKEKFVIHKVLPALVVGMTVGLAAPAGAVSSAELYTTQVYGYGRFEARVRFAPGDGVISSFFLWKPNSQLPDTFWNELDFEKLGADCHLQTNPLYGLPVADHSQREELSADLCGEYHTYTFEWTPSYIAYLVDGVEVRRDTDETAAAFVDVEMEIHFNVWPGDATFGGNFDPAIMPVHQDISWVQYSSYADGNFTFAWREDFTGGVLPSGWAVGNWPSPKNLSTHAPANVGFVGDFAVLSLTADDATGFDGTPVPDPGAGTPSEPGPSGGAGGASGVIDAPIPPMGENYGGADSGGASAGPSAGNSGTSTAGAQSGPAPGGTAGTSTVAPSGSAPAGSSDGSCSQVVSSTATPKGTAWLALVGAAVIAGLRRRRRLETGRPGSRGSLR
jgi:endo-1,3-1,4-beta-glycanase ExoK